MMKKALVVNNWNDYLNSFTETNKDIYFTENYVKLHENDKDRAECFVFQEGKDIFLFPYLKRKVEIADGELYDLETPNGYGGPLANTCNEEFIGRAFKVFCQTCKENKVICGFVRLHPLLQNYKYAGLNKSLLLSYERKTIGINLDQSQDDIWNRQIHPKHRNAIRKAENSGLRFAADDRLENMDEFIKIYNSRMKLVGADKSYFFDGLYYKNIIKRLGEHAFLGIVFYKDKIISAAVFFYYGVFGHYHLSGSLEEYIKYCPNNLLIYNAALHLKEKGIKLFHLGGGTSGDMNNTLYKFKKRFSKNEYDFYIAKMVFDERAYKMVCTAWENKFPQKKSKFKDILLKYRY